MIKKLCSLILLFGPSLFASEKFPDIIFQSVSGSGGYGRLTYSSLKRAYELVNGRINSYVIDGNTVRLMRLNESGGSMANPNSVVILNGKIFGTSSYSQILEYDSQTGEQKSSYNFDSVQFSGGTQPGLFTSENTLLVLREPDIFSIGSDLKLIKKITIDQKPKHVSLGFDFIQQGTRLYSVEFDNPNTYTNCVGGCKLPMVIRQTIVDFTDSQNIYLKSTEEKYSDEPAFHMRQSLAILHSGWIIPQKDLNTQKMVLEYHPFTNLAKSMTKIDLPPGSEILAMSHTEPIFFVLKAAGRHLLSTLQLKGNKLSLKSYPIDWLRVSSPSFHLNSLENKMVVTADYQLAVYDLSTGEPKQILQQNFIGPNGSGQFHFGKLTLGYLESWTGKADRSRVSAILSKDYWNDKDQLAIASDVENLKSEDKWAIPLFVNVLKKKTSWYNGGMIYSLKAIEKYGPDAAEALPYLLNENLGSSFSEPQKSLSFSLIKKIDPTAEKTIQLTKSNLDDAFKVQSTVELLEYIGAPKGLEVAKAARTRWKLK